MASVGDNNGSSIRLNIMPMLDIFSILILFLLMNFSTDPFSYDVSKDLILPDSQTFHSLDEMPTIRITKSQVYFNDQSIASIVDGDIPKEFLSQGSVQSLFVELQKTKAAADRLKSNDLEKSRIDHLTIEADKGHTFKILKRILLAAQQAGYISFKLMVSKPIE
jgi:biopolymer transport protein ExbD